MKNRIKSIAQSILGFENYLLCFSLFKTHGALRGKYESGFNYFISLIPDRGVILDIGANIGITAIPMAKIKKDSVVYAFEPIHENFKTLQKVARFYKVKNLSLTQTALGNSEGKLKMVMPISSNAKLQGLSKVCDSNSNEPGVYYDVPVKRLDDLLSGGSKVSAMKIDVENFEYEVLRGAENILRKDKPIIYCELWDNDKRVKVFDFIREVGYSIFLFNDKSEKMERIGEGDIKGGTNFFFIYTNK